MCFNFVGSNIYTIGGKELSSSVLTLDYSRTSSRVSILDCPSQTWQEAPRIRVEQRYTATNVLDGKLYVAGGFKDFDSSNWMEVFDTKTETCEHVLSSLAEICSSSVFNSAVLEGEIYLAGDKLLVYKQK